MGRYEEIQTTSPKGRCKEAGCRYMYNCPEAKNEYSQLCIDYSMVDESELDRFHETVGYNVE